MHRPPVAHLQSSSNVGPCAEWSFGPSAATAWLWCEADGVATLRDRTGTLRRWSDGLEALGWMEQFRLGRPAGARWAGFLSYELGRRFEPMPRPAADDPGLPLFAFGFYPDAGTPPEPQKPPEPAGGLPASPNAGQPVVPIVSTFDRVHYLRAVERALAYIRAGDVFQVNLSQRLTIPQQEPAAVTWRRALQLAPPRWGAWLQFDGFDLISLSPELFLHVRDRQVTTRPIKGTRPNTAGQSAALRDSTKDAAELNMIIDLERNDLGRVCQTGSVRVDEFRTIEAHPTVLHGVASVTGLLRPEINLVELLRATFPGGSVTGAPKIRAMQIIDELEPVRRHAYCGAIGYLAADGSLQFNVAIRTMTVQNGQVHLPVGGGIVADSLPSAEYDETLLKAAAMLQALDQTSPAPASDATI